MIVVDTSVLIDHLRGVDAAREVLIFAVDSGEVIAASVLTRFEILAGMRAAEEPAVESLFEEIQWVPVDTPLVELAGIYARRFLRSHPGVDAVDYMIAATATALGAALWTRNIKHFPMFAELAAPY